MSKRPHPDDDVTSEENPCKKRTCDVNDTPTPAPASAFGSAPASAGFYCGKTLTPISTPVSTPRTTFSFGENCILKQFEDQFDSIYDECKKEKKENIDTIVHYQAKNTHLNKKISSIEQKILSSRCYNDNEINKFKLEIERHKQMQCFHNNIITRKDKHSSEINSKFLKINAIFLAMMTKCNEIILM
uniref:Uncharacterized protein n=1 Tax=Megaviridae environmental sample TaxID=1737588 RepID=A0A5J6VJE4_9VIRU|nr:MAG: hypothetical protein [Megaviridae environmental sample]